LIAYASKIIVSLLYVGKAVEGSQYIDYAFARFMKNSHDAETTLAIKNKNGKQIIY
jgi:hypothetical protein